MAVKPSILRLELSNVYHTGTKVSRAKTLDSMNLVAPVEDGGLNPSIPYSHSQAGWLTHQAQMG